MNNQEDSTLDIKLGIMDKYRWGMPDDIALNADGEDMPAEYMIAMDFREGESRSARTAASTSAWTESGVSGLRQNATRQPRSDQ
jgi:hypothetical protein